MEKSELPTCLLHVRIFSTFNNWGEFMEDFLKWKKERRKFLVILTPIAVAFFLFLPISIGYFPNMMNQSPFGLFTYAWIFAFLQIAMTWLIGYLYWRKMKQLDEALLSQRQEDKQ